jgi:hypothetical protein
VKGLLLCLVLLPIAAAAQTVSQRGFAEGTATLFPQRTIQDPTRAVGDLRVRDELFYKPAPWVQFAAGIDVRANSHDQVDDSWALDYWDRGIRRPRLSVRRLTTTLTRGRLTLDTGKQFIRWGKTDIVTPTDRFAPRDFLNVIDPEFLAVTAVRAVALVGRETFDGVWMPRFTPSRVPLSDQRWSGPASTETLLPVVDGGAVLPSGRQLGVRWSHVGDALEFSVSYFDGFNHLPTIDSTFAPAPPAVVVTRVYPAIRTYGADLAVPTQWFTVKAESAYFTASSGQTDAAQNAAQNDEYVLYVVQLECQSGEWVFVGGYAGEIVTRPGGSAAFAPDRGLSRSLVGRASYTIGPTRSVAVEGAVRQNGDGVYAKGEYSQAYGQHWRVTVAGVLIRGENGDFLGQYRRNSNATLGVRYSF